MRRIIFISILSFLTIHSYAQVLNINVVVNPPFSPYYEDYLQYDNRVLIIVNNLTSNDVEFFFRGDIIGDNGVSASTKNEFRPISPLMVGPNGSLQLTGGDLEAYFNFSNVDLNGITEEELVNADGLPEGNYQICVQALDWETENDLSLDFPMGCSSMISISPIDPPIIINPICEGEVLNTEPQNVVFNWSISPGALPNTRYRLQLVELLEGQDVNDAFNALIEPPFFETETNANVYVYGAADPPLTLGKKYGIRVQSFDQMNKNIYRNDGYSEVCLFNYGPEFYFNLSMPDVFQPFAHCGCNRAISGSVKSGFSLSAGDELDIAGHTLIINELLITPSAPDWQFSGSGTITMPFINSEFAKVKVTFTGLQINDSNEVIAGSAKAIIANSASFLPQPEIPEVNTVPIGLSDADALDQYFDNNSSQLLSQIESISDQSGFELPLGIDNAISDHIIAITGMYWTPENAAFDAAVAVHLPGENPEIIAFSGTGICFDDQDLCGQGKLFLSEDIDLSAGILLKKASNLQGSNSENLGTHITFNKDGFERLHIYGQYELPSSLVNSASVNGGTVIADLIAEGSDWGDWVATVDIEPFKISGVEDFTFIASQGTYDHSDIINPNSIPASYTDATTNIWRGFHFESVSIELPELFSSTAGPIALEAQDLILDGSGTTVQVVANNILSINEGSLGGWAFSMDQINIDFHKNSLKEAGFNGKLLLPISANNIQSQLDYTCLIQTSDLSYQFVVQPKNDIEVPMWYADMNLENTSTIKVEGGTGQGLVASANLNGDVTITIDVDDIPKVDFKAVEFEGLNISTKPDYFYMEKFTAGLSSPQKMMSGLPVSVESIGLSMPGLNEYSLDVELGFRLTDLLPGSLNATTDIGLVTKLDHGGSTQQWSFERVQLNDIGISGGVGPVDVDGKIQFYRNHPKLGDGVGGKLKAELVDMFGIDAMAMFGSKLAKTYWAVDATVKFQPGIPVGSTPFSVYGFGGGVYSNLTRTNPLTTGQVWQGQSQSSMDAYSFQANNLGAKANIILGLSEESVLSIDGSFGIEMNASTYAVKKAYIEADVSALAPMMNKSKAVVTGEGRVEIDMQHKIFSGGFGMNIGVGDILTGTGQMGFMVDVNRNQWFFKLGDPEGQRISTKLKLGLSLNSETYFSMGNSIPLSLPQIPEVPSYNVSHSGSVMNGSGVAFGSKMQVDADLKFLIFYMKFHAGVGFDVSLGKLSSGQICKGYGEPGINGWLAKGQAYAYGGFDAGLHVDVWFYEGDISILEANFGALFRAEVANPNYIDGRLYGSYSVLDGLISGHMNFHVQLGEKCKPDLVNPFAGESLIESLHPSGTNISITSSPQAVFNYPVDKDISFRDTDGKRYDFLIDLDHFNLYKVVNGKDYLVYNKLDSDIRWSHNKRSAAMYFENSLESFTKYKLKVKLIAKKKVGNNYEVVIDKGKHVEESKSITFTTGGCPDNLKSSELVKYSYPLDRQRYFLHGESNKGFIQLSKELSCLTSDPDYTYHASFKPFNSTGTVVETPLVSDGKKIRFTIPNLEGNTPYRLILIKRKKPDYVPFVLLSMNGGSSGGNNTNNNGATNLTTYQLEKVNYGGSSGSFEKLKVNKTQLKPGDIEMLTLFFKTSKFNNLAEKLAATSNALTVAKDNGLKMYIAKYLSGEGFDVFDTHGKLIDETGNGHSDLYVRPLVRVWENRSKNIWYKNYLSDFYNRAGNSIADLEPRDLDDLAAYGHYPPTRPIKLSMATQEAPLSNSEIFSYIFGDPPQNVAIMSILYGVPWRSQVDHTLIRLREGTAILNSMLDWINLSGNRPEFKDYLVNTFGKAKVDNSYFIRHSSFKPIQDYTPLQIECFLEFRYPKPSNFGTTLFGILADFIPYGPHKKSFTINN